MNNTSPRSMIINTTTTTTTTGNSSKKKMKRIQTNPIDEENIPSDFSQWKSVARQQLYSSKLLQALTQLRIASPSPPKKGGQAVREAADRVLAVTAKGRTRWSRAILMNRLKIKFMKKTTKGNKINRKVLRSIVPSSTIGKGGGRWQKKTRVSILRLKAKNLPAFQRKARLLGRLVPGCRKEAVPAILEEATDYISALEMQVRAMTVLTNLLSGSSSTRPPAPTPPPAQ